MCRAIVVGLLLIPSLAIGEVKELISTEKLPRVERKHGTVRKPEDNPPAAKEYCQCKHKCGKLASECQCSRSLTSCVSPVQLDAAAIQRVQDHYDSIPVLTCYTKTWCQPCGPMKAKLGNGDETVRIVYVYDDPPFWNDLKPEQQTVPIFVGQRGSKGQWMKHGVVKSIAELRESFEIHPKTSAGILQIGTVKRAQLRVVLPILERIHEIPLKNDEVKVDFEWFTAHLPANFKATRTKDQSGNNRIDFAPHPNLTMSILSQDCKGLVLSKDRLTFELPHAPDVYLGIED